MENTHLVTDPPHQTRWFYTSNVQDYVQERCWNGARMRSRLFRQIRIGTPFPKANATARLHRGPDYPSRRLLLRDRLGLGLAAGLRGWDGVLHSTVSPRLVLHLYAEVLCMSEAL